MTLKVKANNCTLNRSGSHLGFALRISLDTIIFYFSSSYLKMYFLSVPPYSTPLSHHHQSPQAPVSLFVQCLTSVTRLCQAHPSLSARKKTYAWQHRAGLLPTCDRGLKEVCPPVAKMFFLLHLPCITRFRKVLLDSKGWERRAQH